MGKQGCTIKQIENIRFLSRYLWVQGADSSLLDEKEASSQPCPFLLLPLKEKPLTLVSGVESMTLVLASILVYIGRLH